MHKRRWEAWACAIGVAIQCGCGAAMAETTSGPPPPPPAANASAPDDSRERLHQLLTSLATANDLATWEREHGGEIDLPVTNEAAALGGAGENAGNDPKQLRLSLLCFYIARLGWSRAGLPMKAVESDYNGAQVMFMLADDEKGYDQ